MQFCQSCAMPLLQESDFGTEKDGGCSKEYCTFCYQRGQFTQDFTMEQMIEHCLNYLDEFNKDAQEKTTPEQARAQMKDFFPQLKRWQLK